MAVRRFPLWSILILLAVGVAACWAFAVRYDQQARRTLIEDKREDVSSQARAQLRLLESELQKFRLIPVVLGEYSDLRDALRSGRADMALNDKLALLTGKTGAAAIFILDATGRTIAASNARNPDSFVGQNYAFRPYYQLGWRDGGGEYFALGTVSRRPGLYLARRVDGRDGPMGVIVVKVEFDAIERAWADGRTWTFVADQNGILLLSSDPARRFLALKPVSPALRRQIQDALQFGGAPLTPVGLTLNPDGSARLRGGGEAIVADMPAPVRGWRLYEVAPIGDALAGVSQRTRIATMLFAIFLALLGAILGWFMARRRRAVRDRERLEREVALRTEALGHEMEARSRADRRYRQAREELAHANRLGTLGTISAGVAHEINQPVAAIRTFAENAGLFLEREKPEQASANLREIVAMTDRIGSITAQLRRFARRGVGEIGPVPLVQAIEGVRLLIADRFRGAGVRLTLPDVDPGVKVRAGRVRLEQVLINLLNNALDAVSGQPDAWVMVTLTDEGDRLYLDVRDSGPGIDPASRDDLFMPFATSKPGGLGLGLHIARDIMVEFGGALDLVSDELHTVFRMTLVKA
ncbi:His Kinase A domain protein [Sphingobium herbicidovorans NBRC 16415]|uniref:C4-dicarboxylate transport sensor protein DctB n=1 Tax=Sphingobium herbicidovorans (strain ATCC 700291 / DSM 11019 / CCUG 56400 / KCTC 2939 / LMG 18315 / NBRC 16415 / MH) TaxID=1219045 RepID=A0A086P6A4_SPHHM|nr:ATP-binding protein [Sphingobium herbicidovorans]KFG88922.1 His Kinase A domain protein [Sphingobium herbicidovorans NBRC 16415]